MSGHEHTAATVVTYVEQGLSVEQCSCRAERTRTGSLIVYDWTSPTIPPIVEQLAELRDRVAALVAENKSLTRERDMTKRWIDSVTGSALLTVPTIPLAELRARMELEEELRECQRRKAPRHDSRPEDLAMMEGMRTEIAELHKRLRSGPWGTP